MNLPDVLAGQRPRTKRVLKSLSRRARRAHARVVGGDRYRCPVCGYHGAFLSSGSGVRRRPWAECGSCGAYERHRLQAEVLRLDVLPTQPRSGRCLYFAPDPLTPLLRTHFEEVVTAGFNDREVDLRLDIRRIDLPDDSFDVVVASHVLEHVDADDAALREIARILRPTGVAVLPVPLIAPQTVEYGGPNPREEMHVRAPGLDYFDRYLLAFESVRIVTSEDVRAEIQPWIHEDRTVYPNPAAPLRPAMPGERHVDAVPLCSLPRKRDAK